MKLGCHGRSEQHRFECQRIASRITRLIVVKVDVNRSQILRPRLDLLAPQTKAAITVTLLIFLNARAVQAHVCEIRSYCEGRVVAREFIDTESGVKSSEERFDIGSNPAEVAKFEGQTADRGAMLQEKLRRQAQGLPASRGGSWKRTGPKAWQRVAMPAEANSAKRFQDL